MTSEPYFVTSLASIPQPAAASGGVPPYLAFRGATVATAPADRRAQAARPTGDTTAHLVGALLVTGLDLFLFLPAVVFTSGAALVLVVPVFVSVVRSGNKGYGSVRTWLRAAVVGLLTAAAAAAAAIALLIWMLASWQG